MADTGVRLKRLSQMSGISVSAALVISIIALSLGMDSLLGSNSKLTVLLPMFAGFAGVVLFGYVILPILKQLKIGQIIREDGPQSHLSKTGTPTMGGVFIVPVGVFLAAFWSGFDADVLASGLLTLAFGAVGWLDDWQILVQKSNKGIAPRTKLLLLAIAATVFCIWMGLTHPISEIVEIALPLQMVLPLGLLFWPLAMFVLLGSSNATNLTDGMDGLAAGTGAIALTGLSLLVGVDHPNLGTFCACIAGSYLGFLWHNCNPAKVFMGDTGSLALGGALAAVALLGNMLWGLALVGAIFIWETITVMAQVSYYKATKDPNGVGKRLFKMAPYHNHLELSGWQETQVVGVFYLVGLLLALGAIALNQA
jgi:phospho-N-acetylmuramoyl-pentapeptide-transferase